MRYFPFVLLLLVVGCSSQRRDYDSDPWRDYEPRDDRTTYDETYIPPSRMNADQLVDRALRAERDGRDDQARVDYQQAFRRDRWHPPANERYQDLMLRNDLFDDVWQEYLDLWQQNPTRGDAFWFHVRPMLERRAESPLPLEVLDHRRQPSVESGRRPVDLWALGQISQVALELGQLAVEH